SDRQGDQTVRRRDRRQPPCPQCGAARGRETLMDAPDKVLATPAIRSGLPAVSGWLLLVWGLTLASALAVPYSAHWSRQLLNELATEMTQREKAQAEWGRLVLEQSTWTAHSRVESIATRQLGMRVPEAGEVILVQP